MDKKILLLTLFLIPLIPNSYAHTVECENDPCVHSHSSNDLFTEISSFFESLAIQTTFDNEEKLVKLINAVDSQHNRINQLNESGGDTFNEHEKLDEYIEEIVKSNVDPAKKKQLLKKTFAIQDNQQTIEGNSPLGGTQGVGILTALDHVSNENARGKLIENANKFELDVKESAVGSVKTKPIVNIRPSQLDVSETSNGFAHEVHEIPVFWWSEFSRENEQVIVQSIKTTPEHLGIDFESTPKTLSGNNNKIHAIVDSEFIDHDEEQIEVEVKLLVGDDLVTTKDVLLINKVNETETDILEEIMKWLGR